METKNPISTLQASEIQEYYQLSLVDALIIAAAYAAGGSKLLIGNLTHRQTELSSASRLPCQLHNRLSR